MQCAQKSNKSLSRQGTGPALSFTERVAVSSLFLHRISVICVNLFHLTHNTEDTVGQCLHQLATPLIAYTPVICFQVMNITIYKSP